MKQIIDRGNSTQMPVDPTSLTDGQSVVEIMVPGPKVGLVIGKGGETIRQLQVNLFGLLTDLHLIKIFLTF